MKSFFLIGSLIVGALCIFSSADAQEAEANKIHSELKTLYQEIGKDLGFVGEDELRGSTLGSPIQVYMSGLDDIEKYKDGEDPHSLLRNTNEFIFPIYSGGTFKSSITLMQEERDAAWELASFGGAEAKLSELSRSKHSDASRRAKTNYMAVHVPSMQQLFVGYDDNGKLFLIPCHKNDLINLEADVAIPAEAAIAAMKPHVAKFRNVLAPSTANTLRLTNPGLTNPGFEEPRVKEGSVELVETMPGWKTTDTHFEIWGTGFKGVPAHEGTQFVELNAFIDGTLYQDSTGIQQGSVLEFTFAHRGRNGDDTMKLTITDLGADNSLGGGDDTVLFTKEYTTGQSAWAVYDSTNEQKIEALGNTVRFAYGAISTATGELGEGNLLDAANFGLGVVSMQQAATGIKVGSWEIHQGGPPVAFDTSDHAGLVAALDKATIPPQKDAGWKQTSDSTVNVHEESAITNRDKTTVDYTFFQVIVNVPEGAKIKTFQVNFDEVDDSARAWIFNSKHPEGSYFPDADVLAGGQNVTVAADFKDKVVEGENRIVITQYDNMPFLNTIKGIHIIVDGQEVKPATLPTTNSTVTMVTAGDSATNEADAAEHILTRDLENQKGAVWTEQKIDFNENFTISAEIYLGTKDDDGADGLALVFQALGNHLVSDGGGLGYQGISPSIVIEFDTYHNGDKTPRQAVNVNNNDPVEDHVGLRTDGNPVHTASDYVVVENLEDGKYHPITFEWNAGQQTFNLSLDGKQIFKERSIPENGLAGQQVYFGFTAATGGLSNEHKVRSISFSKR